MRKITFTDIMFWILMALIIGTALWKLFGSPTDTASLIAITIFMATSEIFIWRELITKDKRTCIGFEKIKSELKIMRNNSENSLENIKNELSQINNKLDKNRK